MMREDRELGTHNTLSFTKNMALLGAGLFLTICLVAPAQSADRVGQVNKAEGEATGLVAGNTRNLAAGDVVFLQEILQTGSEARLGVSLGATTRLNLGELTRVRIDRGILDKGGEITLQRGAILFNKPIPGGGGMVVNTPFAVVAARGTKFFVGPSNDVIGVFVQTGTVNVSNRAGSVDVTAGHGTNLTSANVAPTPPSMWGAGRIKAALESVQ